MCSVHCGFNTTKCFCPQLLRGHSWQWAQEVLGEDAGTHVALRDLQHAAKTDRWWRKIHQRQDDNFLCNQNARYGLKSSASFIVPCAMMSLSVLNSFSLWLCEGPFVFTGNTSTSTTPGTQKKPKFDLKESLSRPLTYKPHTGTEPPFSLLISSRKSSQSANRLSAVF